MLTLTAVVLIQSCAEQEPEKVENIRPVRAMIAGDLAQIERHNFPGRAKATHEQTTSEVNTYEKAAFYVAVLP